MAVEHTVVELCPDSFEGIDIVIGSTPDEIAEQFVPWAVAAGAVVVDESGAHRMLGSRPAGRTRSESSRRGPAFGASLPAPTAAQLKWWWR